MFPLDPKTVERVARIVCDQGGQFERRGYELERLLQHAGWGTEVEYDGTPRVSWLIEVITERRDDTAAIERLLCRVCDPVEYDDGMESAEVLRQELNRVLESEQLAITYVSGRPVVGKIGEEQLFFSAPDDLDARLPALIEDTRFVELLLARVRETKLCESAGSHALAVIGIGSFVEGLLYSVLVQRDHEIRDRGFVDPGGRRTRADRLALAQLIDIAHHKGWIQIDAKDFMHKVRDYRNLVHPRHQLETNIDPDKDTVMMCWGPAHAVLNDLEASLS